MSYNHHPALPQEHFCFSDKSKDVNIQRGPLSTCHRPNTWIPTLRLYSRSCQWASKAGKRPLHAHNEKVKVNVTARNDDSNHFYDIFRCLFHRFTCRIWAGDLWKNFWSPFPPNRHEPSSLYPTNFLSVSIDRRLATVSYNLLSTNI